MNPASWRLAGLGALLALSAALRAAGTYDWHLPRGFPTPAVPSDNPMTSEKVELGARLFADPRVSVTGRHSCASCHDPGRAFTDGRTRSIGATGAPLPLNAPTLFNVAYQPSLGWRDAAVTTLEQQMRGPLFNEHPPELGLAGREADVEREWRADAPLRALFVAAFPGEAPVTVDHAIRAIAAYERTLLTAASPFDRYVFGGDHAALSAAQKRGMDLFYSVRVGCASCHGGINFSGDWVDALHPGAQAVFVDTGTGVAVRVPTLRNLTATAPYLHDGRLATLDAVLDHYETLAADPAADARLRRAPLTTVERNDLRDFLESLADGP